MKRTCLTILSLILAGLNSAARAQTAEHSSLNLAGARQVIDRAMARAAELKAPGGTFAVVDAGGNLLALERLDGTFAASANVSIGKARTAALFQRPTKVFEEIVNKGRTTMVTLPDFTPLQGGVPVMVDGKMAGAIGVSGAANADQDEELAQAGAAAFASMTSASAGTLTRSQPVESGPAGFVRIAREQVDSAFAVGMPLLENPNFKIHASRRTEPGMAEVHATETDIVYVVAGSATLVTGGTVVEPMATVSGETRGRTIEGGAETEVTTGDVFVVPAGVPHWFRQVEGPFQYFVVKPIAPGGTGK
jgi:uncharacterized protein GlcG (DUF336 family)/mannose-6-phosphate isomerase-like protein (cupin superfamily)